MKVIKKFRFERISCSTLLFILIVSLLISCNTGYAFGEFVVEGNLEYQINSLSKKARVSEVILTLDNHNIEIVIPKHLNDGTDVEGIGFVSKGEEFLNFSLSDKVIVKQNGELNSNSKVIDYYVTINFDINIEEADSMINNQKHVYKIDGSEEYIRIIIEFQVSSGNKYYYSKDGILYKK